ncbi:MFS transporter [Candidatus Bathyarchaeota archaeon]|jgi:MFS family permease|nr:MFS transporter [Candidatus Bathyarchaeota archaeon]
MTEPQQQLRYREILSYGLIVMALTHTLTHAFQNMHSTLYPILKEEFMLSNQQIGLISSIPSLSSALLSIPTGLLSDKIGSKKMILLSNLVAITGAVIAGVAQNPLMLILAVSMLYVNTTIYHPASYSFTTFLFKPQDRSKALGLHGAGGTLGMAIGPISVSIIVGLLGLGWRYVYLAWVIPLLLSLIAVYAIKVVPTADDEDKTSMENGIKGAQKLWTTSLILFLVYSGLKMAASNMTLTFLSLWLVNDIGFTVSTTSLIIGASSLMGIFAAPIGGALAARYGEKRWTYSTLIISISSFALAFLLRIKWVFPVFYLGYGFFNLLSMAANSAIMAKLSPSRQRGLGFALYFLPGSIMGAIGPIVAAFIADSFGIFTVFIASMVVFASSWTLFTFGVKVD